MQNAIILHGLSTREEYYDSTEPSSSNSHWFPWLQRQLILKDFKADTPEIPFVYKMNYTDWVREVERFEITEETLLVGHSMGGGFWVRYLSEHPETRVAKVVLVAPWLNLSHEEDTDFFDFTLNPNITRQTKEFVVFESDNDSMDVQNSVAFLKEKLSGVKFVSFHNYGHFCFSDMKTAAFPELLEETLK